MAVTISDTFIPDKANTPIDARTVVDFVSEIPHIKLPYEGMLVYCKEDKKIYKITSLKSVKIGPISSKNCAVDTYEELKTNIDKESLFQEFEDRILSAAWGYDEDETEKLYDDIGDDILSSGYGD